MKDSITAPKAAAGVLLALLIAVPLYAEANIDDQQFSFPASVNVTPPAENMTMGVDPGNNLDFGIVAARNGVRKTINISSPQQTLVTIDVEGNITPMLSIERSHYFSGTREITAELNTTADDAGYYTGNVTMTAQTAGNGAAERWLSVKSLLS